MESNPTEFVEFHIDPSKLLIVTWKGFVPSKIFRQGIDQIQEMAKQGSFNRMVIDSRKQNTVSPGDNDYAAASLPRLFAHGVEKIAFVLPEMVLTKMGVRRFERNNPSDIKIANFDSKEEAMAWLK